MQIDVLPFRVFHHTSCISSWETWLVMSLIMFLSKYPSTIDKFTYSSLYLNQPQYEKREIISNTPLEISEWFYCCLYFYISWHQPVFTTEAYMWKFPLQRTCFNMSAFTPLTTKMDPHCTPNNCSRKSGSTCVCVCVELPLTEKVQCHQGYQRCAIHRRCQTPFGWHHPMKPSTCSASQPKGNVSRCNLSCPFKDHTLL